MRVNSISRQHRYGICAWCFSGEAIEQYAYALHDKDNKKPHYHLLLKFRSGKKVSTIINLFKCNINQVGRIKSSWEDAEDYLRHANAPDKYQYDDDVIVANYDWKVLSEKRQKEKDFDIEKVVELIGDGTIRAYNIHEYITVNQYTKYTRKIESAFKYRDRVVKSTLEKLVEMKEIVWVYGETGLGKTSFAKMLAKSVNKIYALTATGKNIFDDYQDEPCIIIDDLRPDTIEYIDLLGILDPYNHKPVLARYRNKALQAELIIITTLKDPISFCAPYREQKKDDRQLYRRITTVYEIKEDWIIEKEFDEQNVYLLETGERYPNVFKYINTKKKSKVSKAVGTMMENLQIQAEQMSEVYA